MTCGFVSIRLRQLIYGKLTNKSVTYVSGTFVTLDTGLNNDPSKGEQGVLRAFRCNHAWPFIQPSQARGRPRPRREKAQSQRKSYQSPCGPWLLGPGVITSLLKLIRKISLNLYGIL